MITPSDRLTTRQHLLVAAAHFGAVTAPIAAASLEHPRALTKIQSLLAGLHCERLLERSRGQASTASLPFLYWPTDAGLREVDRVLREGPLPEAPRPSLDQLPGERITVVDAGEAAVGRRRRSMEATLGLAQLLRPHIPVERPHGHSRRDLWVFGPRRFQAWSEGSRPGEVVRVDGVVCFGRPHVDVLVVLDGGGVAESAANAVTALAPLLQRPGRFSRYVTGTNVVLVMVSDSTAGDARAAAVARAADRLLESDRFGVPVDVLRRRVFICGGEALLRPVAQYADREFARRHPGVRRRHWPNPTYRAYALPDLSGEARGESRMVDLVELRPQALARAACGMADRSVGEVS